MGYCVSVSKEYCDKLETDALHSSPSSEDYSPKLHTFFVDVLILVMLSTPILT